jgi:hypothetical protein
MILKFKFERVYGRPKFYPMSEEAKIITNSTDINKKCLSKEEFSRLIRLARLGATIEVYENMRLMTFKELLPIIKKD